uniref:Secreted protein n=1 Tax=Opuntia streptacantha TaxID=393608 RepID=A0A7C9DDI6_OPUST
MKPTCCTCFSLLALAICIILECLSSNQRPMDMSLNSNGFNRELISIFSWGPTTLCSLLKYFLTLLDYQLLPVSSGSPSLLITVRFPSNQHPSKRQQPAD